MLENFRQSAQKTGAASFHAFISLGDNFSIFLWNRKAVPHKRIQSQPIPILCSKAVRLYEKVKFVVNLQSLELIDGRFFPKYNRKE